MARKIRTRVIEEYETDEEESRRPGHGPQARPAGRGKLLRRVTIGLLVLLTLAGLRPGSSPPRVFGSR
jgi:hypothetical protein